MIALVVFELGETLIFVHLEVVETELFLSQGPHLDTVQNS